MITTHWRDKLLGLLKNKSGTKWNLSFYDISDINISCIYISMVSCQSPDLRYEDIYIYIYIYMCVCVCVCVCVCISMLYTFPSLYSSFFVYFFLVKFGKSYQSSLIVFSARYSIDMVSLNASFPVMHENVTWGKIIKQNFNSLFLRHLSFASKIYDWEELIIQ